VAAAIWSTVAPSGRLSRSIMSACLVPLRGAGFSASVALISRGTPQLGFRFTNA
jgi:hypothetical protein